MFKFIALQNEVYYSLDDSGDKIRFYANRQGTGYDTRKEVTPEVLPDASVIREIYNRPSICYQMSDNLKDLVNMLEKNFIALEV